MTVNGMLQIALYVGLVGLLIRPLGRYIARVFNGERTWLDPALRPIERFIYRIIRCHGIGGIEPGTDESRAD